MKRKKINISGLDGTQEKTTRAPSVLGNQGKGGLPVTWGFARQKNQSEGGGKQSRNNRRKEKKQPSRTPGHRVQRGKKTAIVFLRAVAGHEKTQYLRKGGGVCLIQMVGYTRAGGNGRS